MNPFNIRYFILLFPLYVHLEQVNCIKYLRDMESIKEIKFQLKKEYEMKFLMAIKNIIVLENYWRSKGYHVILKLK